MGTASAPQAISVRKMNIVKKSVHKNLAAKNNLVFCRYHPAANLIDDHQSGSLVCPQCGLVVVERMVSEEAEWRNFNDDDSSIIRSRVGATENALLSSEKNLETSVARLDNMNEYGATIYKRYAQRSSDKALTAAFRRIEDMADRINLPEVVSYRAKYIFKEIFTARKYKGNIIAEDSKVPACLFLACQQEDCPRTMKEVSAVSGIGVKHIQKARLAISKELHIVNTALDSKSLIPRFCGNLNLSSDVQKRATKICREYQKSGELKMFPETMVSAAIYIAAQRSDQKRTQKDIGESVGLTTSTLSRTSRLISQRVQT